MARWWWLMLLGLLLGGAGALAYLRTTPPSFQSTALLEVLAPGDRPAIANLDNASRSLAAQAATQPVFEQVSQALEDRGIHLSAAELLGMNTGNRYTLAPIKGANIISIQASHGDPAVAQQLADTTATVVINETTRRRQEQQAQRKGGTDTRKTQLEQQIAAVRDQLMGSQLYTRQLDLEQKLREQRALLVQLQLNYTQGLQQQVQLAQLIKQGQTAPTPTGPTPEQQRQLDALTDSAARAQLDELGALADQATEAERTLADLDRQVAAVQQQLAASGADQSVPPDVAVAQLQQQQQTLRDQDQALKQARQTEQDLLKQQETLRGQQRQLQQQLQQELARQSQAQESKGVQLRQLQQSLQQELAHQSQEQQAKVTQIQNLQQQLGIANDRIKAMSAEYQLIQGGQKPQEQLRAQQLLAQINTQKDQVQQMNGQLRALQQAGTGPTQEEQNTVQLLRSQIQQLQQASATVPPEQQSTAQLLRGQLEELQQKARDVDQQVQQAQAARAALEESVGPDPLGASQALAAEIAGLQQQRGQQGTLQQQLQDLLKQQQSQRAQLLQARLQYQQAVARQADAGRQQAQQSLAKPAPSTAAPALDSQELAMLDLSRESGSGWLDMIKEQQQAVQTNIDELSDQLQQVQQAIASQPTKLDALSANLWSGFYQQQLSHLEDQYATLQATEDVYAAPQLARLGPATPPVVASGSQRILPVGAGLGLAVSAALAYLLDKLRRNRAHRMQITPDDGGPGLESGRRLWGQRRYPHLRRANGNGNGAHDASSNGSAGPGGALGTPETGA